MRDISTLNYEEGLSLTAAQFRAHVIFPLPRLPVLSSSRGRGRRGRIRINIIYGDRSLLLHRALSPSLARLRAAEIFANYVVY